MVRFPNLASPHCGETYNVKRYYLPNFIKIPLIILKNRRKEKLYRDAFVSCIKKFYLPNFIEMSLLPLSHTMFFLLDHSVGHFIIILASNFQIKLAMFKVGNGWVVLGIDHFALL